MKGKNHRFVFRKQEIEIHITQTVRMLGMHLDLHQIHYIHHSYFKIRNMFADYRNRREYFQRRHVTGASHYHIGFDILIVARPGPDAYALGTMYHRFFHFQPLWRRMFSRDYYIHIVAAAKAMIHDG